MVFSFVGGQISLLRGYAGLRSWESILDSHMVCDVHLFVLSIDVQAGLEPAAVVVVARNGIKFSQCNVTWGELGVQNVESLILVDALFLLH
jgi:hypothetical protein